MVCITSLGHFFTVDFYSTQVWASTKTVILGPGQGTQLLICGLMADTKTVILCAGRGVQLLICALTAGTKIFFGEA